MLKAFIPDPLPKTRLVPFVADAPQEGGRLFQDLPQGAYAGLFERTFDLTEADIVILPHEYAVLKERPSYLHDCLTEARTAGKHVLLSAYQDDTEPLSFEGVTVLRSSAYKSALSPHEIVMPAYVEDLGAAYGSAPREKGTRPSVGFVGKAAFSSVRDAVRYVLKDLVFSRGNKRSGMYFRRRALQALAHDARIDFRHTPRRSFSAHKKSIELPQDVARAEYIASIQENLFTLAPRGDGNYSLRFYETLSLGRIPILIDTDMPLPLESELDYDAFTLRIPWEETQRSGDYIASFFAEKSEEELNSMQQRACEVFTTHLFMPAFLRRTLTRETLGL